MLCDQHHWCQLEDNHQGPCRARIVTNPPRLEDIIRVFHDDCGGIAIGPIDNLHCAECGKTLELTVTAQAESHEHDLHRFDGESPAAQ